MIARKTLAVVLSVWLVATSLPRVSSAGPRQSPAEMVDWSYLDVIREAHLHVFSSDEIRNVRDRLEDAREQEEKAAEDEVDRLRGELDRQRDELERLNRESSRDAPATAEERRLVQCRILDLETDIADLRFRREQGIRVDYDNRLAKLDLIANWRDTYGHIRAAIASGHARDRHFGDVEDIGFRDLGDRDLATHQQQDIRIGEDAAREMRLQMILPGELDDEEVTRYVTELAESIARNSDLRVPIRVTVLDSSEVNAFSLPGGLLYVHLGLLERAANESELVGVLAHEIAHAAARHGARLQTRGIVADILFSAAQIASVVLTGGIASLVTYYGVGMALELSLLGVSRAYEAEADQLGVQYAWKAGYDSRGFITFFDKMASEEGYVRSASFFRTHPPFYERILSSFSEIAYLPPRDNVVVDSSRFQRISERIDELSEVRKREEEERPTLRRGELDCPGDAQEN